jgi:Flp pilus assembly protein TadB
VSVLVLAAAAAAATWLAVPGSPARLPTTPPPGPTTGTLPPDEPATRRWLWASLAGLGGWAFAGGTAGLVVGVLAGAAVWTVLSRAEPPARRRRRLRIRAELPHLVGLLAAAVRGGLPPADGLRVVCAALAGPAAETLAALPPRISLGIDPVDVWRSLEADPALAPLGRTMARSARTGEPVADALDRLGDELAAQARAETEDAARRVGVQAAVPLGLCLLPAFLLLGIVPVVVGLVGRLAGLS